MVGESSYIEWDVRRAHRTIDTVYKAMIILVCAVFFVGAVVFTGNSFIKFLFTAALIAMLFLCFYVWWPRFNVVYEYVYVDGQIDFDAIYSGSARKHLFRVDMDKIDVVAPLGSSELAGYEHLNLKAKNFSSYDKANESKQYVIIAKGNTDSTHEKIIFEPSEEMLTMMKKKSPRKINIAK